MTTPKRPGASGSSPLRRRGKTTRRAPKGEGADFRITEVQPATPVWQKPPVLIGAGAGALLLIIIIAAAASGGSDAPPPAAEPAVAPRAAPKKKLPDVTYLISDGKSLCEEGAKIVRVRVNAGSSVDLEQKRRDLEKGLKLMYDGLAKYDKARELTGKSYKDDAYRDLHAKGVYILCDQDLEKVGKSMCDEGLTLIQSTEKLLAAGTLPDDQQRELRAKLENGISLIQGGMNYYDRSYQVSGHTFEARQYSKALKAARMKVLELKK